MSSVVVLCPNGQRQQIKVEPNTKILQILEEACLKSGYLINEYDLIHHKRHIDLGLAFRLSGIPNNATLELKKLDEPRKDADVIIVLQLEDGSRLPQITFKPDSYLNDVLNAFKSAPDSQLKALEQNIAIDTSGLIQPVCIYINDEIIGEFQIRNTQLKDLGLTGGRVIIRFAYRHFQAEQLEASNSAFQVKLNKKLVLEQTFQEKLRQNRLREERFEADLQAAANNSEVKETSHIFEETKSKRPKIEENESKIGGYSILKQNSLIEPEEKISKIEETSVAYSEKPRLNNEFANFKFPESTKGMKLNESKNELAEIESLSRQPCPREALVYTITEAARTEDELSDEFFDVTINDLRYMMKDLQNKINDEKPLATKAMRELEDDKKAMRYEQVVIRIRFKSSNLVLQGFFRPKEPISHLYDFVKEHVKVTGEFNLYTTPPKVMLSDKKKTLFEYHLYPAAIVHFGTESDLVPAINQDLLSNIKTLDEANDRVNRNVHQKIRSVETEGLNWLQRETALASNLARGILGNQAPTANRPVSSRTSQENASKPKTSNDMMKDKMMRFLGSKK